MLWNTFLLLLCAGMCISSFAQNKLIFTNVSNNQTIFVKAKDLTRLSFKGYRSQIQEIEGVVSSINDSAITFSATKRFLKKRQPEQSILIRDITGFRKYSRFRPAGEIIYAVASVGITGGVSAALSSSNSSAAATFISAAATQAVTTALKNLVLSKKIKSHLQDDWTMQLDKEWLAPARV